MATRNTARTTAWSVQLAQVHQQLREQLARVRTDLIDLTDPAAGDLMAHCLAFCSALSTHHVGEDDGLFAELLRVHPDLAPVVDNLVQDHRMIATILTSVRELAAEAGTATAGRRSAIGRELDGLSAIVESHFRYEERAIGTALDGVGDTGWRGPVLDPGRASGQ